MVGIVQNEKSGKYVWASEESRPSAPAALGPVPAGGSSGLATKCNV